MNTLLLLMAAVLVFPPLASAVDFRTPGKAAYCDYVPQGEIIEGGVPNPHANLFCWTPNDGFYVTMKQQGKAGKGYGGEQLKGSYAPARRVLRFGQTWRRNGFVCTSRSSGVSCRNRSRRGWWLGRYVGYRIY